MWNDKSFGVFLFICISLSGQDLKTSNLSTTGLSGVYKSNRLIWISGSLITLWICGFCYILRANSFQDLRYLVGQWIPLCSAVLMLELLRLLSWWNHSVRTKWALYDYQLLACCFLHCASLVNQLRSCIMLSYTICKLWMCLFLLAVLAWGVVLTEERA